MRQRHKFFYLTAAALALPSLLCVFTTGAQEAGAAPATRKVSQPEQKHYYISAKRLELKGTESVKDAMAIYRMALHNGASGAAREEAYLGLARCEYRLGNYWRSFQAVQSSLPDQFDARALQLRSRMEMDLASILEQLAQKPVKGSKGKDDKELSGYQAAAIIYEAVIYNDPKSDFARKALQRQALCYQNSGDLNEAEKSYYKLVNTFPRSQEALQAQPEMVKLLALKSKGEGGLRGKKYDEAIDRIRQSKTISGGKNFQEKVKQAEQAVQENAAETKFNEAMYYRKRGGRQAQASAEFLLRDIIRRYPQTKAGKQAQELVEKYYGKNGGRKK